jgi:hypothetical protein
MSERTCGICERVLATAPPEHATAVLCALCAAVPQLVAAYREGRARAEAAAAAEAAS